MAGKILGRSSPDAVLYGSDGESIGTANPLPVAIHLPEGGTTDQRGDLHAIALLLEDLRGIGTEIVMHLREFSGESFDEEE